MNKKNFLPANKTRNTKTLKKKILILMNPISSTRTHIFLLVGLLVLFLI